MGQGAPVVMHEQLRRHIERAQALLSRDAGPLQISDSVSEKYSVLRPLFAQSLGSSFGSDCVNVVVG